ncbi:AMP-dependent synthetase/ligase domain-containing protein [Frankia sp. AiPs1]|uniref:TIGR03089 family protein n=1 Tax=Frankia sp. AiPa1 TaxID=573492 RepID=UPI00202B176E|nr:TIGR03089 family protein [Frankia sp. AiPa1]MCL9757699.1 TIGR03089 family protein [Frankia sp. AiPa1]
MTAPSARLALPAGLTSAAHLVTTSAPTPTQGPPGDHTPSGQAPTTVGSGALGTGARGVADLLARRVAADPARPLVTFYDDATGERVEFSATTLDNWVAKTANLLVDTLGLGPGDQVGMDLPTHWLALVVALATWSVGGELLLVDRTDGSVDHADGGPPDATRPGASRLGATRLGALFIAEDRLDATGELVTEETVALSLRPLGGRMTRSVPGVLDFAAEVPPHGDRFVPPPAPPAQLELVQAALRTTHAWRLAAPDRLLVTAAPHSAPGLLGGLLAPLAAGASVVLCRRLDPDLLSRRLRTERVTAIVAATPTDAAFPAGAAADGAADRAGDGKGDAAARAGSATGVRALHLPPPD